MKAKIISLLDEKRLLALVSLITVVSYSVIWAGDIVHLNTAPTVLNTSSIPGTPIGIATDASGHVIAVTEEGMVFSLSGIGAILDSEMLPGPGNPVAITMNDVGDIYVVKGNGTAHLLNTGLTVIASQSVAGTPVDITVDPGGLVYIATASGTIYKRTGNLGALASGIVSGAPTAIFANLTGDIFVTTSGGIVHRLNAILDVLDSDSVPGTPIDVAADAVGTTIVATSGGVLHSITNTISVLNSRTLTGTLIGVDLDDAGHVVAANNSGTVFVANTGLTSHTSAASGATSLSAIDINLVGDIYVVGGTGAPPTPMATFSSTTLPFGLVTVGTSASLTFSVTSSGTASLEISSVTISTPDPAGIWTISPVVPPIITLPPPSPTPHSQTFTVTLNVPSGLSSDVLYNATISVATNDPATPIQTISASGTGHVPVTEACYSANFLSFGQVNTGNSEPLTFIVESCGDLPLQIQSVMITTMDPSGVWTVSPLVPPVINLAPGNTRTFTVTLNVPSGLTSDTPYSATITVTTNDDVTPVQVITATGTGHVPMADIYIDPIYFDIDYREVELGFHFSRPLLIENRGDLELSFQVSYVDPADADRDHFALETGGVNFTIPPMGMRIFRQTFQPRSFGNKEIVLMVHNTNDPDFTSQNITLHGVGTPPIPIDAVLLLDRSGSMSETAGEFIKIEALQNAAGLFTELLRDDVDFLGLTKYDHENSNILDLGPIATVRSTALTRLSEINDPDGIQPRGRTGIGGAMRTASSQYAFSPDPSHKKVMVVLTDGEENERPSIREVLDGDDSYPGLFTEHPDLLTYSVGLGVESNINRGRLQEIANRVLGGFYLVTGNLEGLNIFNLENFYFKIFADAIGHTLDIQ